MKCYLSREGKWKLPVLRGIVSAPTLRPDGSLLDKPGYDEASGIYFDAAGAGFLPVPEHPTREQAQAALGEILELFAEFPYESEADRAVAVCFLLTALSRGAYACAPRFGFTAPVPGSGKSKQVKVVGLIGTGHPTPAMTHGDDRAEENKRVFATLLECEQMVLVDNISRPYGGDAICSALSEDFYKDRILGVSGTAKAATGGTLWAFTGNNLTFRGDITRRVILSTISPKDEDLTRRTFRIPNLEAWALENRARLVRAGLTILRAYVEAGWPNQKLPPFGGFEGWSDLVRSAAVWVGLEDPLKTQEKMREEDPERVDHPGADGGMEGGECRPCHDPRTDLPGDGAEERHGRVGGRSTAPEGGGPARVGASRQASAGRTPARQLPAGQSRPASEWAENPEKRDGRRRPSEMGSGRYGPDE